MAMENVNPETYREARIVESSGSIVEGIAGVAAIALAIIGLAGDLSGWMVGIATILVGIVFLFEGGSLGARFTYLSSLAGGSRRFATTELGGGITAQFSAGLAGIILGILTLLGIFPVVLVSVAAIVYGGALILGMGAQNRLSDLQIDKACDLETREMARVAVRSLSGMHLLIGLGAITLGILAVVGLVPVVLSLIAMLTLGFSGLLSGAAVGGRMLSAFNCG